MAWFDRWRRRTETGEAQLARVQAAMSPPADPPGSPYAPAAVARTAEGVMRPLGGGSMVVL